MRRSGLTATARLRLVLTGHGGGTWDLILGGGDHDHDDDDGDSPRQSIVADAVGFCRLAANRITPADLGAHVTGSRELAAGVLAAVAALALD